MKMKKNTSLVAMSNIVTTDQEKDAHTSSLRRCTTSFQSPSLKENKMNTTSQISKVRRFASVALALSIIWTVATAQALAANIWDGGGADANWDTLLNWDDNLLPAGTADVTFGTGFGSGNPILLNGPRTVNNLTINATSSFGINNDTLTVNGGAITRAVGAIGLHSITSDVDLGSNLVITNLSTNSRLDFDGSVGEVGGTRNITIVGPGTTRLSDQIFVPNTLIRTNTYSGTTTVRSGTLRLQHINVPNSLATTHGNSTYQNIHTDVLGSGTSAIELGDGSTSLSDNITLEIVLGGQGNSVFYDQGINVNAVGATTTIVSQFSNTTGYIEGDIALGKDLVLHKPGSTGSGTNITRLRGIISGVGGLIKTGADSSTPGRNHSYVIEDTSNSYSGGTRLEGGSIAILNNNVLGSGAITFAGGALASFVNATRSVDNSVIFEGNAGFGGFYPNFSGDIVLSDTGTAPLTLANTLMSVRGRIGINSTATLFPQITGVGKAITKDGPGTLVFAGANTYDGGTAITEGTLRVATTGALGTGDVTVGIGALLDLLGDEAIDDGAKLNVDYVGISSLGVINVASGMTDQVIELIVGGISFPEGLYNETNGTLSGVDFSLVFAGSGGGSILVDFQVPEPSTGLLVVLGFMATLKRTRRRRATRKV